MKQISGSQKMKPGISRRHAVSRLLQVVAGGLGVSAIAGCPGGSTWKQSKLEAQQAVPSVDMVGSKNTSSNLEISTAEIPVDTALELTIAGEQAYLYRGQVDGAEVWHAVSRTCTHMNCTVDFNSETQEYNCPCHRSKFSSDGTVLNPPAKSDLQTWEVIAHDDVVEIVVEATEA